VNRLSTEVKASGRHASELQTRYKEQALENTELHSQLETLRRQLATQVWAEYARTASSDARTEH